MDDEAFESTLAALRADRSRGAAQLARGALAVMRDSARGAPAESVDAFLQTMARRVEALAEARPSMAAIGNLLAEWCVCLARPSQDDLPRARRQAAAAADELIAYSRDAAARAADHAAALIGADKTILTHSYSSCVLLVCERLKDKGLRVVVTESRPLNEGGESAAALAAWGVPVTLITDAQIGLAMADADLALVGADTVCADGGVVNKAGTLLLALAARQIDRPFYVCFEGFKRASVDAPPPVLEEMDPAELGAPARAGVAIRNRYFDITPSALVTAWINERGVASDGAPN